MAYVNTTRVAQNGLIDRIAAFAKTVAGALHRRRVFAQTLRELNGLSDRELADLGLHKSMIRKVAHEAAYGK